MRKIVIEFTLLEKYEKQYENESAEPIIADFFDFMQKRYGFSLRILSDVVITEKDKTNILIKNL